MCVLKVCKCVWMYKCERLVTYLVLLLVVVAARHARRTLFAIATARGRCSQARSSSRVLMPSSAKSAELATARVGAVVCAL